MNVLNLFDGMSCGMIALERIGIVPNSYYSSEIDKYAITVSNANYPNIIRLGDITKINTSVLPKIDLLMGGSPCQGFSFAGKQLNFDDPRSKLFFEFVRILKETEPRYFLLENVVMKKQSQDVISEALGVQPILIDSALVSAQMRKRLYWTNIPNITLPENKNIILQSILESDFTDRTKSFCLDASYFKGGNLKQYFEKSRRQLIFKDLQNISRGGHRKLTPAECERLQNVPDNYTANVSNSQRYKMLGNGWTVDIIAHILNHIPRDF